MQPKLERLVRHYHSRREPLPGHPITVDLMYSFDNSSRQKCSKTTDLT